MAKFLVAEEADLGKLGKRSVRRDEFLADPQSTGLFLVGDRAVLPSPITPWKRVSQSNFLRATCVEIRNPRQVIPLICCGLICQLRTQTAGALVTHYCCDS